MPIITLTSDWGLRDHYLAAVKGTILSRLPQATIIDITHQVEPFNLRQASFILRNSYPYFPAGTVHIIAIRTEETKDYPHAVICFEGQYFIGTDHGVFSLIFNRPPDQIIELSIPQESDHFTFPTRDRFVAAAIHLAEGKPIGELGRPRAEWSHQMHFRPVVSGNVIRGMAIYIDNYENVITNITRELFDEVGKGRPFVIECRGEQLEKISTSYLDVPEGDIVALFGTTGHLEIAINQGNASGLLGLEVNDPIRVEFT
jgi:S-adenosylmethionine hydrolase